MAYANLKSMEKQRHSRAAAAISAITGMLLGILAYSLWLYPEFSFSFTPVPALAGAVSNYILMLFLAWIYGWLGKREQSSYRLSASLVCASLLLSYLLIPLYLTVVAIPFSGVIMALLFTGLVFIFLAVVRGLFARRAYRRLTAVFLVMLVAGLGGVVFYLARPGVKFNSLPLAAFKHAQGPVPVRIQQSHHSRIGLPLAVGRPYEASFSVPESGRLVFDLGVIDPDKDLPPLLLRVTGLEAPGQLQVVMEEAVKRDLISWTRHGCSLQGLEGQQTALKIELLSEDYDREDYKPLFIANLAVFSEANLPPENVIILVPDALRADALGCYGGRTRTPVFDMLAQEGVLFERAVSPSSWTMAAVDSIFSSKMPTQHRSLPSLDWRYTTLPQALSRHGIMTGAVMANYMLRPMSNYDKGFQEFQYQSIMRMGWRNTEKTMEDVIYWIERKKDQPFFLYAHVFDPHHPYMAPPPEGPFSPAREGFYLASSLARFFIQVPHFYRQGVKVHDLGLGEFDLEAMRDRYLAEVEYVDSQTGLLVEALKEMGIWDRTLLIVTSDHGEEFQEHGHVHHAQTTFRDQIQVPLIFSGGAMAARRGRVKAPVSTIDLFPTVLDFLGLEPVEGLEGVSLVPWLDGEQGEERPAFSEFLDLGGQTYIYQSMLEGDYHMVKKIALPSNQVTERLLFRWDLDPAEADNIYLREPEIAGDMESRMDAYFDNLPERKRLDVTDAEILHGVYKKLKAMGYIK